MQSNVHYKQTFTASWSKSVTAWLCELRQDYKIYQTFCNLLYYFSLDKALQKCLPACRRLLFPLGDVCTQATKVSVDGFKSVCCPSYREYSYSKMTEKRQWPKPGVRLTEVSVKTELTVKHDYIAPLSQTVTTKPKAIVSCTHAFFRDAYFPVAMIVLFNQLRTVCCDWL